jgi:putative hydrolase of HD superfamily
MNELVELLLENATLKRMPRTGWEMRGVPHVESVADHSYGVVFVALALVDALQSEELDLEKVLVIALLHDLAEVRVTDLPASATHLISAKVKRQVELSAITELLAPLPSGERWVALWHEFEDLASPEGCLVRDADKLEMMIQCLRYEQAGSRGLDEYWQGMDQREWHYTLSAELYARLKGMRPGSG